MSEEHRVLHNEQSFGALLERRREGYLEFVRTGLLQDLNRQPQWNGRRLSFFQCECAE